MRGLIRAGWPPERSRYTIPVGVIAGLVMVIVLGPTATFITLAALATLLLLTYVVSLLYVRYSAKGRAEWLKLNQRR